LAYPHRLRGSWEPLDLTKHGELNFLPVEKKRFPALGLAYAAINEGGSMPAVLNAANEVAVAAFLAGRIGFREIHRIIERTMQRHQSKHAKNIDEVIEVDRWAREAALAYVH
jgi:1-deoxy-D-xylulose-5-phosphate reductoisomerase